MPSVHFLSSVDPRMQQLPGVVDLLQHMPRQLKSLRLKCIVESWRPPMRLNSRNRQGRSGMLLRAHFLIQYLNITLASYSLCEYVWTKRAGNSAFQSRFNERFFSERTFNQAEIHRNDCLHSANSGRLGLTLDSSCQSGIPALRRHSAHLSIVSLLRYKFGVVYRATV